MDARTDVRKSTHGTGITVRAPFLTIVEVFASVQGEGVWTGHPAIFVRTAGCSVRCGWCDTKYSWEFSAGKRWTVSQLIQAIQRICASSPLRLRRMIFTGGEPLEQPFLGVFAKAFRTRGWKIHLETSGAFPFPEGLPEALDWLTLSPKPFAPVHPHIYPYVHELKVVIAHPKDLDFALQEGKKVPPQTVRMVQPEWRRRYHVLPAIMQFLTRHPEWSLSLQTHKYWGIP